MMGHYFETPHLIAAYSNEKFIGVFVTLPEETISVEQLDNYFSVANPTCFVAEEIDMEQIGTEITIDNYVELLADMIEAYMDTQFSDLPSHDLLFMPKTLH